MVPKGHREPPEQVVAAHAEMLLAKAAGKSFKSPGEYLGDIEVTDVLLGSLTNVNTSVNSIEWIPRGTYLLIADFDYEGDGPFKGLHLEQRVK